MNVVLASLGTLVDIKEKTHTKVKIPGISKTNQQNLNISKETSGKG